MNQRESRYVKVAKIAHRLTKQALPKYSQAKSLHHFEPSQWAGCGLMMVYLDVSYRDMEEWLLATDKVCQALELPHVPGHTRLQRTSKKLRKRDFEKMKNQILEEGQDWLFTWTSQFVLSNPQWTNVRTLDQRCVCSRH